MVNSTLELYTYANQHGIDVDWVPMYRAASLSVPLPGNTYAIALNPWKMDTIARETVSLAHELGHCETGSFYNRWAMLDLRKKHEHRADKWGIQYLIPVAALDQAVADGHGDIPALAEHFGVTEDFMRKAVCWYTHGNLATELYF